jgi:hypothetical protein
MMLALTLAAVAALGPRPAGLTGGDPAAYAAWLHARTLTADRAFGAPPCPTATVRSLGGRVLPRAEQAEGEAAARTAGQPVWLEQLRLEGCGRSTVHTLQTIRRGPGRWSATATFPGALRSTPRAQTEAVQRLAGVILNGRPALPCSSTEALRTLAHTPGARNGLRRRPLDRTLAHDGLRRRPNGRGDLRRRPSDQHRSGLGRAVV